MSRIPSDVRLPSVVIVGRPNVGKSTLFNTIIGQRKSIVGDEPGITRDRIYGEATYQRKPFELIDTGGIIPNDAELIPANILKQAQTALEEADQIIFVIDGRTEITSADRDLAIMLRKLGKPVTLAVNKIDVPKRANLTDQFHEFGFRHVAAVSAEHRLGVGELLEHITEGFPEMDEEPEPDPDNFEEGDGTEDGADGESVPVHEPARPVRVSIIGRPNVGKSTLLNALAGEERVIVTPIAGTTRDAVDETVIRGGREFVFVDTAGIRRKGKTHLMAEKLSVVMARRSIRMAHVVVVIIEAVEGVTAQDATIAGYAHEAGRPVILVVNKVDAVPNFNRKDFEESVRDQMKFLEYAPIHFISAKSGSGVGKLFEMIRHSYDAATHRVTTGELNRFVELLHTETDVKIKYITQAGIRPPTFILFTEGYKPLHFSTERFLVNQLRKRFGFEGVPLVLKTKVRKPTPGGQR
jgi:GTP-binding protein